MPTQVTVRYPTRPPRRAEQGTTRSPGPRAWRPPGGAPAVPPKETAAQYLRQYYRHVSGEDLADRADVDVYGAALSHYRLATERPQGTATVRVFTPTVAEHGWSADGHTVVEVVTDDMSFLVDSVTMELNEQGRSVHLVVHPQLLVRRDVTGAPGRGLRRRVPRGGGVLRRGARVVDARGDRPGDRGLRARGDRATAPDGAQRRAGVGRGLGADAPAGAGGHRRPAREPPAAPRARRSRRAPRCWPGWPTTTSPSSATGSTGWPPRTARPCCGPCPARATASCARTRT